MIESLIDVFLKVVMAIIIIDLSLFAVKDIMEKRKEFYKEIKE